MSLIDPSRARTAYGLALLTTFAVPAAAQSTFGAHDVHLEMEQVPTSWPWWTPNNDAMWLWNQIMDLYRFDVSDGFYGANNGESGFAGFPSEEDLQAIYGSTWGSALGITFTWFQGNTLTESDIVLNPNESWTTIPSQADGSDAVSYLYVVLHELGHSWGMNHIDSDGDSCSIMLDWYPHDMVHPGLTVHALDALTMRNNYDDQLAIETMRDMGVFSHYIEDGSFGNTSTDSSSYRPGDPLTVESITVENIGTEVQSDVHIRLYLSTNDYISTADHLLGDWSWGSFGDESVWTGDLTGTVPAGLADGTYWVGAIVTSNGTGGDDHSVNDRTRLFSTVQVEPSCTDDIYEPNDFSFSASPLGESFVPGLSICDGDVDWYRFDLQAGEYAEIDIYFQDSNGDLDLELFDGDLNPIDSSTSTTDSESVSTSTATQFGTYYVRVYGFLGATNSYDIDLDMGGTCHDVFEINDTQGSAYPMGDGSWWGLTLCEGDVDWFGVDLGVGEMATFEIHFDHDIGDLDFNVYDPSSTEIGGSYSVTDTETFVIGPVAEAGFYTFEVYGHLGATNVYDLSVDYQPVCPIPSLTADKTIVDFSLGEVVDFDICAGAQNVGDLYWLVGSSSGTAPGLPMGGLLIPLNYDTYSVETILSANQGSFLGTLGTVGPDAHAGASILVQGESFAGLVGLTIHHAAVVLDSTSGWLVGVTNAVPMTIVP